MNVLEATRSISDAFDFLLIYSTRLPASNKKILQRSICLGTRLDHSIQTKGRSLNGEENEIMQSDHIQNGFQIRCQKIWLMRSLSGIFSPGRNGYKDWAVA
jgi:hypothetical protein